MQPTQRTPEMDDCLRKSKALFKVYYKTRSEEDHEAFKQAERERARQWYTERSKIIVKCKICNVEMKKPNMKNHLHTKKHISNIQNKENDYDIDDEFEYV